MAISRIILCRHGETDWNREGRYQGVRDIPLNERGRQQAQALARSLAHFPIHRFVSSPLSRAHETAEAIRAAQAINSPPHVVEQDPDFREISHGIWEGRLAEECAREVPDLITAWRSAPHTVQWPGGETLDNVARRAASAFNRVVATGVDRTTCIVAHDAVNKVLLIQAASAPLSRFWAFKQDSTCMNVLDVHTGGMAPVTEIVLLNSVAHLGMIVSSIVHKAL